MNMKHSFFMCMIWNILLEGASSWSWTYLFLRRFLDTVGSVCYSLWLFTSIFFSSRLRPQNKNSIHLSPHSTHLIMPSRRNKATKASKGRHVTNSSTPTRSSIPVDSVGVAIKPSGTSSVPVSGEVAAVDANTPASNVTNCSPSFGIVSASSNTTVSGRR